MKKIICFLAVFTLLPQMGHAKDVLVSIKPVHSLVAAVMDGVDKPTLLVTGANSPHDYSLKPSDAKKLASAKVIFWIGPEMETFLQKPIKTLGDKAVVVAFSHSDGITLEDGQHAHDGHDGHGENMHIWLDPVNAKAMVGTIEKILSAYDPDNQGIYKSNANKVLNRLDNLIQKTGTDITEISQKPYIVFHDAYGYFEKRFNLSNAGAITLNPELKPGAKKIREIKQIISQKKVVCVFSEPQFDSKMVDLVQEGTSLKAGVLDPLGSLLDDGPDLYFDLITSMSESFRNCLK